MKIFQMGPELFHAEDRRTDMKEAFRQLRTRLKKAIEDEATKGRFVIDFRKFCH
jgi:hypothetical protein